FKGTSDGGYASASQWKEAVVPGRAVPAVSDVSSPLPMAPIRALASVRPSEERGFVQQVLRRDAALDGSLRDAASALNCTLGTEDVSAWAGRAFTAAAAMIARGCSQPGDSASRAT